MVLQQVSKAINDAIASTQKLYDDAHLLQSLQYPLFYHRQENIRSAHDATLNWIFSPRAGVVEAQDFRDWLQTGSGVFWIKGKPGSGKSTFMKYIFASQDAHNLLRIWAKSQKLVTADFYFWSVGSKLQKSQDGLIRSLLFEILVKCPDMSIEMKDALTNKQFSSEYPSRSDFADSWTITELLAAFDQMIERLKPDVNFCFFIDGLDEYGFSEEGNPVIDFIQRFATHSQVKFCVSSRPWNEFENAFGHTVKQTLRVESHTVKDIEIYVDFEFARSNIYKTARLQDDQHEMLVQGIVARADGVFLWVFLAVRSLLKGLNNADSIKQLNARLEAMPPTLEAFFERILDSIEPEYKKESKLTFLTALESESPLDLMLYGVMERDFDLELSKTLPRLT